VQSGHGTGADGTEAAGLDAADLWVRDPRTGEYRLRLPGEPVASGPPVAPGRDGYATPGAAAFPSPPPPPSSQPYQSSWSSPSSSPSSPTAQPTPSRSQSRSAPTPGRAARRRRERRPRSGPWVAAVACFLLAVGGTGGYLLLRHGSSDTGSSADAAGRNSGAPGAGPSASCSAHPAATGPVPEPAVSGAFLTGSRAEAINVRVTLLNGTGSIGVDETVLTWLQSDKGFLRSSNGGPASATARTTTLVYAPNHVDQARTLAAVMGLPATALRGDGKTSGDIGRMVLTLGQDFHGLGKPFAAPAPTAPASAAGAQAGCATP
jgi:hypothetical protein